MFVLSLLFITVATNVSCFRIINCGSNKIREIAQRTVSQNNKSVIEYSDNLTLSNQPNLEIWCESDCWFSECTLSHQPNSNCLRNLEPYEQTKNHMEAYKDFENNKQHICKFVVDKNFGCTGNIVIILFIKDTYGKTIITIYVLYLSIICV